MLTCHNSRIELVIRISCKYRSKGGDAVYASSLAVPNNMANGECTVALLRSKHRIFSNTSCVFKNKIDLIIDTGSFYYRKKVIYRYVIVIKVNFIDRRHTKVLKNGKNTFSIFVFEKRHLSCRVLP